jgi:DNA-binding response OmpR family regulator
MKPNKVVIIDDDQLIRSMLERLFKQHGWECGSAGNGEEGMKLIRSVRPELLVLDIFLPGKWSGMDVLRFLKVDKNLSEMTVVMITAADPARYLVPCREAGADILIPKPFSPKAFIYQIKSLLEQKGGNEL